MDSINKTGTEILPTNLKTMIKCNSSREKEREVLPHQVRAEHKEADEVDVG